MKIMRVILARPRGFCAGVERAIRSVEQALERYGPPVYVLNDIVHNAAVVNQLRERGAVFVKNLHDVPEDAHVLFSAHGVSPDAWSIAQTRRLHVIDATCPLVEKVHEEARRFAAENYTVVLIGESGHDETIGTMGWVPNHIRRVFTEQEVEALEVPDPNKVAYVTQTTLSVAQSEKVVAALRRRFPKLEGPKSDDICYATQNRQKAVNILAAQADLVLVVGDRASANSNRLAEICRAQGKNSHLISSADAIQTEWFEGVNTLVLTAGADGGTWERFAV